MSEEVSQKEEVFDKEKLYQFDGSRFVQVEPSKEIKVPITEEVMEEVQELRKNVQKSIGMRPELSLVVSAMIVEMAKNPEEVVNAVKSYGRKIYG